MPCASEWIGCLALQIFDTCGSQMQGWCWTFALVHPQCEFRSALLGDWRGNLRWWGVFSHQNDFVSVTQLSDIGGSLGWTWNWPHSVRGAKVWWTATQTLMDDKEYPCTVQRSPRLYRLNAGEKLTVEPNPEEVEAEKGHQTCHSVRQVTVCHRTLVAWSRLEPASAEASLQAIRWLAVRSWRRHGTISLRSLLNFTFFIHVFGTCLSGHFRAMPLWPFLWGHAFRGRKGYVFRAIPSLRTSVLSGDERKGWHATLVSLVLFWVSCCPFLALCLCRSVVFA
jgi:hypothetical protein